MARLAVLRDRSIGRAPAVIFLSTTKIDGEALTKLAVVDAVVAKPILPEMLQPVVDRLMKRVWPESFPASSLPVANFPAPASCG